MTETGPKFSPEERLEMSMTDYIDRVGELGVVSGIIIGTQEGRRGGYLWNVLTEDFSFDGKTPESMDPFYRLNRLGYELKLDVKDLLHLDVAHVTPSQLTKLKDDCDKNGIDIDLVPIEIL